MDVSHRTSPNHPHLQHFIDQAHNLPGAVVTAVVHPVDALSLAGALQAAEQGIIEPWLVGPQSRIRAAAEAADLDIRGLRLIDSEHSHAAAAEAVRLVRAGEVHALMKGGLATGELLAAVTDRQLGLRTERRLSHIFVLDVPSYHKPLLVTDAAINIAPGLAEKADILQNAFDCAHALGIAEPRAAILCAVEKVMANMPATLDAAALCKMVERGQISGGIADGPLAFDNAISRQAAEAKGIRSTVAGEVDILLAPDLEAGNILSKQLQYLAGATAAGIVMGARVPIILTSRADGSLERLASSAVALLVARYMGRL